MNTLIPKNFHVLAPDPEFSTSPQLLRRWPNADLFYKKDDKFKRAKGIISMQIYTGDYIYGFTTHSRLFVEVW